MEDCLLRIFDHLTIKDLIKCESVNRQWQSVVSRRLASIYSIEIPKELPEILDKHQHFGDLLAKLSSNLRQVSIRAEADSERESVTISKHFVTKKLMKAICDHARHLRVLHFERMYLTRSAVECFTELSSELREFSMVNCALSDPSLNSTESTQKALIQMLQNSQNLTRFEITGRGHCSDQFELRNEILRNLPESLTDISLSTGISIKIDDMDFLKTKRLNSLHLPRSFIRSSDFRSLHNSFTSLTELNITSCVNILDCSVVAQFENLRILHCGNIRDGMTDGSLRQILTICTKIEELGIDNCSQVTEQSLMLLGTLFNLRWLSACGISSFTDDVVYSISTKKLTYVCLNFCRSLSRFGVSLLLGIPSLTHLEVLGVPDLPPVSSEFNGKLIKNNTITNWNLVKIPPIPISV